MEPVPSAILSAIAKSVLAQAGRELGDTAYREARARLFGDPERRALEAALGRAFDITRRAHGRRLADYDVTISFLHLEGAAELAKAIVPGGHPSPVRLAEACVDSLGPCRSDDERFDRVTALRPAFTTLLTALAGEVRRETVLAGLVGRDDAATTAESVSRLADHLGAAASTPDDERDYLRWVMDRHRTVRSTGMVRDTVVQLPLDEVFVGLQARFDRHPGDRARAWFDREYADLREQADAGRLDPAALETALDRLHLIYQREFPHDREEPDADLLVLDAVAANPHLVVLGEPGSGKTTLLRYLASTHARAGLTRARVHGREPRLPIYLRIGDLAGARPGVGIGDVLVGRIRAQECRVPGLADLLRRRLDAGGCLVLLDGLDEVGAADRRRGVVETVADFVAANSRQGNRFVVTSRISGYPAAALPEPFRAVRLQEMGDSTIARFLEVYCREVERAELRAGLDRAARHDARQEAEAIGRALADNPGVRRLAASPLLLVALILVHRASGRLPQRRVEAYTEVCHALGRTWRSLQGVTAEDLPDERLLPVWLAELGAWIHEHRQDGAASRLELLAVLGPLWADHRAVTWDPRVLALADPMATEAGRAVTDFVDQVDRQTGLLVERAPHRYGFPHLTFQEYYTGRALAFRGDAAGRVAAIRRHLHDPRYQEPILLALGLIGTDYCEQVDQVVRQAVHPAAHPSPHEHLLGRDFLFLLRVLADDVPVATATVDGAINQAIDEWLDPATGRYRFSAYRREISDRLGSLGATRAGARLLAALGQRAPEASRRAPAQFCALAAVAAAVDPLPEPVTDALASLAATGGDPYVRIRAAHLLTAAGPLPDAVLAALTGMATGDDNPYVRVQAAQLLAAAGPLPESATTILTGLATGGESPYVRIQAAQLLATAGPLPGNATTTLAVLATTDHDPYVRGWAAEALSAAGPLPDTVLAALTTLAATDTNPFVRGRAARALAAGPLPDTVATALTGMATTDDNPYVRIQAAQLLAAAGPLPDTVTAALTSPAVTEDDPYLRIQAADALAATGMLPDTVLTTLTTLATADHDPEVRIQAAETLALAGSPTDAAATALTVLATTDDNPYVRVRAARLLAATGPLPGVVAAALTALATRGDRPHIRTLALDALAAAGPLPETVTGPLTTLATTARRPDVRVQAARALGDRAPDVDSMISTVVDAACDQATTWRHRRDAVRLLRSATPSKAVRAALLRCLRDPDNDVRGDAGRVLVHLARRHPDAAPAIEDDLARACEDPRLAVPDGIERRAGWDYAYDALRNLLEPGP
jgi:HEAT repeat protein